MNQAKNKIRAAIAIVVVLVLALAAWLVSHVQSAGNTIPPDPSISLNDETVSQDEFGQYASNYLTVEVNGTSYEGYRIAGDAKNQALFSLTTPEQTLSCDFLEGSFGNISAIDGMQKLAITYKSDDSVAVSYGNDANNLAQTCTLPAQKGFSKQEVTLSSAASYFRISATSGEVHVSGLDIYCGGNSADETASHSVEGIRYIPETDYNPYEGETLEMPVVQVSSDGTCSVAEWKSYTYHSFEYCEEKIVKEGQDPKTYALTDPVDVANYFVLFNRVPANYGAKSGDESLWTVSGVQKNVGSDEEVLEVFGSDLARLVRPFARNDGYVEAIDYASYGNTGKPLYYEFDIDVDGTYGFSSRGVGRVVGWTYGFACYDDGINVATVTTDHYYTFAESTNCGFFNPYFDAMSTGKTGLSFAPSDEIETSAFTLAKAS